MKYIEDEPIEVLGKFTNDGDDEFFIKRSDDIMTGLKITIKTINL